MDDDKDTIQAHFQINFKNTKGNLIFLNFILFLEVYHEVASDPKDSIPKNDPSEAEADEILKSYFFIYTIA